MKKTVAILLITVMALSFVACAGKKIIGTWELTKADGEGAVYVGTTWVFKDDGTYTIMGIPAGEYKVKGSRLYMNGDTDEYFKLSFSGDTMKITGSDATLVFTKK